MFEKEMGLLDWEQAICQIDFSVNANYHNNMEDFESIPDDIDCCSDKIFKLNSFHWRVKRISQGSQK